VIRYWISNSIFSTHIRILDGAGRTTMGEVTDRGIRWTYSRPDADVRYLAEDCAMAAGEIDVRGATYEGNETLAQMCEAVECTCVGCGKRVAAADELSTTGLCGPCFIARMAVA